MFDPSLGMDEYFGQFWSGWNGKFSKSKFLFFTLLWPQTVENCRNHASKPGKALNWVYLSDTRKKYWSQVVKSNKLENSKYGILKKLKSLFLKLETCKKS